jgi:hypothetical protein
MQSLRRGSGMAAMRPVSRALISGFALCLSIGLHVRSGTFAIHPYRASLCEMTGEPVRTRRSVWTMLSRRMPFAVALLFCAASLSFAQSGGAGFEIGVGQVYHSPFSPWAHSRVNSVDSLPPELWNRLLELGITMPLLHIHGVNDVFPRMLLDTARARGLRMAFIDAPLRNASGWDRRYVQAEDSEHILSGATAMRVSQQGFDEMGLRLDLKDMREGVPDASNVLLFREGVHPAGCVLTALVNPRLLFLDAPYYVTLRCGIFAETASLPPNTDDAALLLRFRFGENEKHWVVPGSAFYDAQGKPRSVLEYFPADEQQSAFVTLRGDTLWKGTDSVRMLYSVQSSSIDELGPGMWEENRSMPYQARRRAMNVVSSTQTHCTLEIEYSGRGDIVIDAVCFSDPHAYGFFVGDEHALQNFRGGRLRESMITRLRQLGVDDNPDNPLRFLELHETMPDDAGIASMNLIDALVDSLAGYSGRIRTFNYGHAGRGGQEVRTAVNGHIVSGHYYYPIWHTIPPPGHTEYYYSLFGNPEGSFWYTSRRFHEHAVAQKRHAGNKPFPYLIPIANNDWSFTDGWRWPMPPAFIVEELREPTAAELRCQVLHALCYGAKTIMYYQYGSMPPVLTSDTVSAAGRFINRGINGFVNVDMTKRRMDVWGEDKWDSVSVFNHTQLLRLGKALHPLRWENAFPYDDAWLRATDSVLIAVASSRSGVTDDPVASTFVEIGQFSDPDEPEVLYLLVVNKRTDAQGQRHITMRVKPRGDPAVRLRITDLLTDRVWHASPLELATTGIRDVYPAGGARLFRIQRDSVQTAEPPPTTMLLHPNYPNPVYLSTTLLFELPASAPVRLSVHDALGREVAVLMDGWGEQGLHACTWQRNGIAAGMYIARLQQGNQQRMRAIFVTR